MPTGKGGVVSQALLVQQRRWTLAFFGRINAASAGSTRQPPKSSITPAASTDLGRLTKCLPIELSALSISVHGGRSPTFPPGCRRGTMPKSRFFGPSPQNLSATSRWLVRAVHVSPKRPCRPLVAPSLWLSCPPSSPERRDAPLGDAERGEAVQHGDANLKLGHLTVEVQRHETMAQQFHTMHLGSDAASAVVATPSSPERTAEIF